MASDAPQPDPVRAFAALGHPTRFAIVRLLRLAGGQGWPAGAVSVMLGVPASTLSGHLAALEAAGLLTSRRIDRRILYAIDVAATHALARVLIATDPPDLSATLALGMEDEMSAAASSDDKVYTVLFLCTGNSARSVMAESVLNRLGQGRFRGFSAGSHPTGRINPYTERLLQQLNYKTDGLSSKSWDAFAGPDAPALDFVFTVCDSAAGETCPVWPGQPMTAHWGFPDPAAFKGSTAETGAFFADVYRQIYTRLSIFVNLPIDQLDKLTLQKRLDEMGKPGPTEGQSAA